MLEIREIMYTFHVINFSQFDYTITSCLEVSEMLEKYISKTEQYVLKNIICQKVGKFYIYYTHKHTHMQCP